MTPTLHVFGTVIYPSSVGIQVYGQHTIRVSEVSNVIQPHRSDYVVIFMNSGVAIQCDAMSTDEIERLKAYIFQ